MSETGVTIDPQGVSNGVTQFETTANELSSTWSAAIQRLTAMEGEQPWADDDPGSSFHQQWVKDKGPEYGTTGQPTIDELVKLPALVRKAVEASMNSDQQQATEITQAIADL